MKYLRFLIFLGLTSPLIGFSQTFFIQAKPQIQTIEAFTQLMDQGAHAIHLEVTMTEDEQLIIGSGILLSAVVKALEWHTKSYTRYEIGYIIELKKSVQYIQESEAVHNLLDQYISLKRVTIQSDNFATLKYWNKKYPDIKLSAFIKNQKSIDTNLANLGFKPNVYSLNHQLLTERKVDNLHKRAIQVIPWTINDTTTMQQLIDWEVDGFITNMPDQSNLLGVNRAVKNGY